MTPAGDFEELTLPVLWTGAEAMPTTFANQFMVQYHEGEIFLLAGTLVPPLVTAATQEEWRKQFVDAAFVKVNITAKLGMTPRRAAELIQVLTGALAMHAAAQSAAQGEEVPQ